MPRREWELDDSPWCRARQKGDDWELYSAHAPGGSQTFTARQYGSTQRAEQEARREMDNRNRRIERLRKSAGLPAWRFPG